MKNMLCDKFVFFIFIAFTSLCFTDLSYSQEEITLSTYYPASFGDYDSIAVDRMAIGSGFNTPADDGNLVVEGSVGIGTSSPQGALDVTSTTGAFIVPRMTTAERSALTGVNGMIVYDSDLRLFYFFENGLWVNRD